MLRKYQGLFTAYYDYVTNLLRLCDDIAGSDTVKPRLHYVVNGIHTVVQRLCNGSATVSATVSAIMTRFGRLNVLHFTPAEQLFVIMMSMKIQLVVKLTEEEDFLLTAAYFQWQIMKKARRKRKKRSVWTRDCRLQCRVLYGQITLDADTTAAYP